MDYIQFCTKMRHSTTVPYHVVSFSSVSAIISVKVVFIQRLIIAIISRLLLLCSRYWLKSFLLIARKSLEMRPISLNRKNYMLFFGLLVVFLFFL